jgi:Flp pilus assembly protein TadD
MRRFNPRSRIAAFLILAVLAARSASPLAQTTTQAPAASPPLAPPVVAPQPQLTPEQLGDTLMTHQRYQAAIEALQEDCRWTSAVVWNKMGIAYQMMFNLVEASRCYQASLKLAPNERPRAQQPGHQSIDSLKDYGAVRALLPAKR